MNSNNDAGVRLFTSAPAAAGFANGNGPPLAWDWSSGALYGLKSDNSVVLLSDIYPPSINTTNATTTTIVTVAIPSSTTVMINAKIVARRTGGSAGTAEDGAAYIIAAAYKNVSGTATEIGESSIFSAEDQAAWAVTVTPSSGNALIQVTGAANNNITWSCAYQTYSVSS